MKKFIKITAAITLTAFMAAGCDALSAVSATAQEPQTTSVISDDKPTQSQKTATENTITATQSPIIQNSEQSAGKTQNQTDNTTASGSNQLFAKNGVQGLSADAQEIVYKLRDLKLEEDQLNLDMDDLELQYKNGGLLRDDYIAQLTELNALADDLNTQTDDLKQQLAQLGINYSDNSTKSIKRDPIAEPSPITTSTPTPTKSVSANNSASPTNTADIKSTEDAFNSQSKFSLSKSEIKSIDRSNIEAKRADIKTREDALNIE